jgi:prepilin-type processing-associated H-X9-DG protein
MEEQRRLRPNDVMIVLACIALLWMTLGATGEAGRRRAKEVVCQANLHRWGDVFGGIVEENDGKFLSGTNSKGHWWPMQLSPDLQDWKMNRLWLCPMATVPVRSEQGVQSPIPGAFTAWGVYTEAMVGYAGKTPASGFAGSYGLNGYVIPIPESLGHQTNTYERGAPATVGWGSLLEVPDADRVPLFLDALRFDVWPLYTDQPSPQESHVWATDNHMASCAINRHDGAVNCLFVDGSVRKVGLKELWTLRWHRSFNTDGPWTRAGGVQPANWPEWMRSLKDY